MRCLSRRTFCIVPLRNLRVNCTLECGGLVPALGSGAREQCLGRRPGKQSAAHPELLIHVDAHAGGSSTDSFVSSRGPQ